jgi:16S rRNA (guanine527-N7)-methyltransferase
MIRAIIQSAEEQIRDSVSRETFQRLEIIVAQLVKWQARINLVSPGTMSSIWQRHVADSLQLVALAPDALCWIDLGSGGGFPGLVVAAALADKPGFRMSLVESNGKKCAFLRETVRLAGLPVDVLQGRIEDVVSRLPAGFDIVSARALAPLTVLLKLAEPVISKGATGLFPKGQDVDDELRIATISWNLDADLIHSQTEAGAAIVMVKSASRKKSLM